ncbi:MAG: helix-turn-helix domain-containing protein [Desulfobacterales bacterium]|nr:helix-turn-helix domain-containing protein [Desulfobacterales bacterium]
MSQISTDRIFTLREAAKYLKIPEDKIKQQVIQGKIQGQRIDDEWRFLKTAIDDWLSNCDHRTLLIGQSGAFSGDDSLEKLRLMIYSERGRPEKETDS